MCGIFSLQPVVALFMEIVDSYDIAVTTCVVKKRVWNKTAVDCVIFNRGVIK